MMRSVIVTTNFIGFTPYGKDESVYDQSRKWKLKISWIERNL